MKTEKNSNSFTPSNAILGSHLCLYIYENNPQPLWGKHKSTTASTCCSRHFYNNLELYFLLVEICWFIFVNSFCSNFLTHATDISSRENNISHNAPHSHISHVSHISLQPFIESTFSWRHTKLRSESWQGGWYWSSHQKYPWWLHCSILLSSLLTSRDCRDQTSTVDII